MTDKVKKWDVCLPVFVNVFVHATEWTKGQTEEMWCHLSCIIYPPKALKCMVAGIHVASVYLLMYWWSCTDSESMQASVDAAGPSAGLFVVQMRSTLKGQFTIGHDNKVGIPHRCHIWQSSFLYFKHLIYCVRVSQDQQSLFCFFLKTDLIYKEWQFYSITTDGPQDHGEKQQRWKLHMNNCK